MLRCFSHLALGVAVALVMAGAPPLQAQDRAKPAAKPVPPKTQAAAPAPAAPDQTTSSVAAAGGNWRVECSSDAQALDCRAIQQIVTRENNQLIAGLVVRVPAETKKPVMMVQTPLGVMVSEGVDLIVDDGKPERFKIQTCNQQGCFVGTPVAEPLLAAMQTGKQLRLIFRNGNSQAITVTMPLTGFSLVYDKVKS